MSTIKKGDAVFYRTAHGGIVRASVKAVHRSGEISVVAMFHVDAEHKDVPGYLGYAFRLDPSDVFLAPPCCLPLEPAFPKAGDRS